MPESTAQPDPPPASIEAVDAPAPVESSNTIGVISLVLTLISAGLCAVMFWLADNLPANPADFDTATTSPEQLRLLIVGCSTGVLTIVSLVLAMIGLLMPGRTKTLALLAAAGSLLILLGVFGVVVLGILLGNPGSSSPPVDSARVFPNHLIRDA